MDSPEFLENFTDLASFNNEQRCRAVFNIVTALEKKEHSAQQEKVAPVTTDLVKNCRIEADLRYTLKRKRIISGLKQT
jgi:hypothetical protein